MSRVPDILVERLRLGELSPEEAARVRQRLADANELGRLDALDDDDRQTLARHPTLPVRPQAPRRLALVLPALVTAAVALVLLVRGPSDDGLRSKGDVRPALVVYRQSAHGYEVLADEQRAARGDVLQLGYVAAGRELGTILSIDGRGVTTVHLRVSRLQQGGEVRLPDAYVLDDAPTFERFELLTFDARGLERTTLTVRK